MGFHRLSFTDAAATGWPKRSTVSNDWRHATRLPSPSASRGSRSVRLRGLVQLGIMHPYGGSNALSGLARPRLGAGQGAAPGNPVVIHRDLLKPIPALQSPRVGGSAAGSNGVPATPAGTTNAANADPSNDWLTFNTAPAAGASDAHGISTPWHPAKRAAGGAAQAPRGGSSGSGPARASSRGAITPLSLPASTPAASAAGGASAALFAAVASASSGAPPAAGMAIQGQAGPQRMTAASPGQGTPAATPMTMPGTTIVENPSSLPSSTIASGPFGLLMSFPYFPLYSLNYIQGNVLVPNGYQQATLNGNADLRARFRAAPV